MMYKLLIALAIVVTCALSSNAQTAGIYTDSDGVTAGLLVYTNIVKIGGSDSYKQVEKIVLINKSAVTFTTVVAEEVLGNWQTISTISGLAADGISITYPARSITETESGSYAVTNYPVAYVNSGFIVTGTNGVTFTQTDQTNYYMKAVLVPVTTTVTKSVPVEVNKLRLITTLAGTNGVATADAIKCIIFAK